MQRVLKFFQKGIYFFQSLHTGFFLGALSRKHLELIDLRKYSRSKRYFKEDYNKKALFEWEQLAVDRHFKECESIMLTAAGGGREVYNLEKQGYNITAFEYNDLLRNYANYLLKKENLNTIVNRGERDSCPVIDKKFDGIIVGFGSYTHIKGSTNRINFLKELNKKLNPDGVLLLSFYLRSYALMNLKRIYKIANLSARICKNEKVELGDSLDIEYIHYFSKEEIYNEVSTAGFKLCEYNEGAFGNAVIKKIKK